METAIERLRASKEKHVADERDAGKEAGRLAAKDQLEYDELIEIEKIAADSLDEVDGEGAFEALRLAFDPNGELDTSEFNAGYFKTDNVNELFALGFIEGAQEFFDEVKDAI